MEYLNFDEKIIPPFKPKSRRYKSQDNFEALQNDDRDIVTEDFEDSPFADREKE